MVEHTWGFPVALDLFFAGLAAGAFCFSVLASRFRGKGFESFAIGGAFVAPVSLVLGMSMLIVDLLNKPRFWLTLTVFNADSPMSLGVWLLTVFAVISVLYAFCWLPKSVRDRVPVLGSLLPGEGNGFRRFLGLLGVPFALGVSVYTGVLLSAASYPLWRNPGLPVLFCFSAIATGFAGGAIVARWVNEEAAEKAASDWLAATYRGLLPIYLFFALVFLGLSLFGGHSEAAWVLLTGVYGIVWWCGAFGLGIVLPLAFVFGRGSSSPVRLSVVLYSLLVGGFLMRLVLVYAGQGEIVGALSGLL
jgi:formate-dependent nitrite reductase membrane component NrfD